MHNPKTATFIISNDNLPFWEELNKEQYFKILSSEYTNERCKLVTIQYDEVYLPFLFGDIFHAGVQCGIKAMIKPAKTV